MKTRPGQVLAYSLLSASAFMLTAAPLLGQSPQQMAEIMKPLPANDQAVISRLSHLNHLPSGDWLYHVADMPHGESPTADVSQWTTVQPRFKSPAEGVWFRKTLVVPKDLNGYDLTGATIKVHFSASGERPMQQIMYVNGNPVQMGEDLETVELLRNAQPGQQVVVAVKVMTASGTTFRGAQFSVEPAESRPNPEDLVDEFLSSTMLIPSLSKNPSGDMATLEKAIAAVDTGALDSKDQQKFDASLKQATSELEPLKPVLKQATFYETGNSHIDAAWLWPETETVDVVRRTFGTALQLMHEYPWYTYTQSAAQYNEWVAEKYPEMNDEIKKRIKEGRWEVVGGMWVEPDLNLPDGESQARSLLIGKRWYEKNYGVDVKIGWNPDSFGYNWQLPQIYKKSGVDYFVTQKMTWSDTNQLPFKLFWWESPDGSKVLTYFPHDYANQDMRPLRLSDDLVTARKRSPGMLDMMDLYGVGDHGGGPTRAMLDEAAHWSQPDKIIPNMKFGTAINYFTTVQKEVAAKSPEWDYDSIAKGYEPPPTPENGQVAIPTWKSELYLEYHRGVFTTQAQHKWNMRHSEEWTLNAEKYASLAWLDGQKYPGSELTSAWEKVTFNDFHDLAAGSGIGIIYKDAQKEFDQVHWATNEIKQKSLDTIAARIDTRAAGAVPVMVFNPLAWQRSGLMMVDVQMPSAAPDGISILDAHDRVLPAEMISKNAATNTYHMLVEAKDIPSMGYEVLHAVPGKKPFTSDVKVEGLTLENAALRVTVDKTTGCITSLYDKKSNFETIAKGGCGNELQAFKDLPKEYDAWNIDPGTLDVPPTLLNQADSVELIEHGPMRAVIRVTRHWQSSKFQQDIQLYSGMDQVNVVNDFDWHETHVLLKAAFPLAATSSKATYEIPYGTIQRSTLRDNSWEKAQFEVPALRWADLGDGQHGFSLINESKYGYDAVGNLLRLTLLRSPVSPDPDADRGHQHFSYALYPHAGDWKQALTERHGYEYNYKLAAMQLQPHTGQLPVEQSFLSVGSDNVVVTALKKAEDSNGLILHMYEWAGKDGSVTLTLPKGATAATETNLMEAPQGSPLQVEGDRVTVPVHPFEIVAVRVDYPVAK